MEDTMAEVCNVKNTGLRGVKVADTKISFIDGTQGVLIYRGYRIEELAKQSNFEETAYLILKGDLATSAQLNAFKDKLHRYRALPSFMLDAMRTWPKDANPMKVLMASVAMMGFVDNTSDDDGYELNEERAIYMIAMFPSAVAAWDRIRRGLDPVAAKAEFGHAENFLYQLVGKAPDQEVAKSLDVCLILHADHTFNASTFACREVVSTMADLYAGAQAGLGALSGPLHGGANEKVMAMLQSLEHEQDVEGWVKRRLEQGEKIMGMGHAVYKTEDPRAAFLKAMGYQLGQKLNQPRWYDMLTRIEKTAMAILEEKGKSGIKPNVDFYSAPVYHLIGLPKDLFTPIFAISRISGWCAHMLEEKYSLAQPKTALYRPSAEYVGQYCGLMGCMYQSVDKRVD
jgi:citrate synthase